MLHSLFFPWTYNRMNHTKLVKILPSQAQVFSGLKKSNCISKDIVKKKNNIEWKLTFLHQRVETCRWHEKMCSQSQLYGQHTSFHIHCWIFSCASLAFPMHLSICLHGFAQHLLAVHSHFSAAASHPRISGKCLSGMTDSFQPHINSCKTHFLIKLLFNNPFLSYQLLKLTLYTYLLFIKYLC